MVLFNINKEQIGWRFTPNDEELIEILRNWIQGERFPELGEVQFLDFKPLDLTAVSVLSSFKEWFFLVRGCMDTENDNTLKGRKGRWRLYDETIVRNWIFDEFLNHTAVIGIKRHYCFYDSKDLPDAWVAYEYSLPSREISENQSHVNETDSGHSIIRLFQNGPTYDTTFFHFEDHQIVDLLLKKNQGEEEFPQFGFVRFFSKEPYQLPVFKPGEVRMYMLRENDVSSEVDRWATPRGKWKIADHTTPTTYRFVMNQARTRIIGGKRWRRYYDHEDKPTVWYMYEYCTSDQQPYAQIVKDAFFVVVVFKIDSFVVNSAPRKGSIMPYSN